MKKLVFALSVLFLVTGSFSCLKQEVCRPSTLQSEIAEIEAYATANSMNGTLDPVNGMYYEILDAGDISVKPNLNSTIYIRYTGKLLNGSIFDQVTDHAQTGWVLGSLIPGWQLGLPQIGEGGHIKLIIPSSLAYGCSGYGSIPGNAILFFEVQLIDVL